jgi:AsmA-like C-terminal region
MALRTWIIRGIILAALSGVGYGLWWAQSYVSPDAVRAALLETLHEQFPDTDIVVGSAHIRVFGGISIRDLTLTRRGEDQPFFTAPSGTIYHDKEQISRGRLSIRKVELDSPTLAVERRADGTWSLEGLGANATSEVALPTLVVQKAKILFVDRGPDPMPAIALDDVNFTLVNDPAPTYLVVKGSANLSLADGYTTRVSATARLHLANAQLAVRAELPDVIFDRSLAALVSRYQPDLTEIANAVAGSASIRVELNYEPNRPLQYDLSVSARSIRVASEWLPEPVDIARGTVRIRNGAVTVDKLVAKIGGASATVSLETRAPAAKPAPENGRTAPAVLVSRTSSPERVRSPFDDLEDQLERIDLTLNNLTVDAALFERLPEEFKRVRDQFSPVGTLAIGYRFERPAPDSWKREIELRPAKLAIRHDRFRYPLDDVAGTVRQTATPDGEEARIDLSGTAGGQRIDLTGTVRGPGPDPAIALKISGTGLPIDESLADALPHRKHAELLRTLRATGRADFVVEVKQEAGRNLLENVIRLDVHDVSINFKAFPYPLDRLRGKINLFVTVNDSERPIRPGEPIAPLPETDRIELRDVTARHGAGTVWMKGDNLPIANTRDRRFTLSIWGKDCPIDDRFREALAAIKLELVNDVLRPEGSMSFAVDVQAIDRFERTPPVRTGGPKAVAGTSGAYGQLVSLAKSSAESAFDPTTDLTLSFNFEGPTVTPEFFPYRMDELAGRLKYDGTRVKLEKMTARHGAAKLGLSAAEVRFCEDGRVWANIGQMDLAPLVVDAQLLAALPRGLREGARELNLRGPAELKVQHMVVLTPPAAESNLDPEVFWKGELRLAGAAFDAGVSCESAYGKLACTGSYLPTHLGKVNGNLWLESASIASHPTAAIKATFDADPQEPDPIRPGSRLPPTFKFTDIQGQVFGGTVGGSGRVVLAKSTRYRLALTATDVRLEDIARHHNLGQNAKLEGAAQASILLETATDPVTGQPLLTGYGMADVDRGQIYNLPPLVPLLKALKLQAPDKTAFEEAHAVFTVRGDRVRVDHIDLLGSAVSLGGSGELDMAGRYVKFDFYTIWSQTLQRWLTTPFGDLTAMVSEKLFKIEVTRKPDGEMKYEPRPVPFVTDPFKAVVDRIRARAAKAPTARANAGR